MLYEVLFLVGMTWIGWIIPEFIVLLSPRNVRVPAIINFCTAAAAMFIAAYIVLN